MILHNGRYCLRTDTSMSSFSFTYYWFREDFPNYVGDCNPTQIALLSVSLSLLRHYLLVRSVSLLVSYLVSPVFFVRYKGIVSSKIHQFHNGTPPPQHLQSSSLPPIPFFVLLPSTFSSVPVPFSNPGLPLLRT